MGNVLLRRALNGVYSIGPAMLWLPGYLGGVVVDRARWAKIRGGDAAADPGTDPGAGLAETRMSMSPKHT